MAVYRTALLAFIQFFAYTGHVHSAGMLSASELQRRRLNTHSFPRTLDITAPLLPINGRHESTFEHVDHDQVVFLDKECAQTELYAEHLRNELISQQSCFFENERVPGIKSLDDYFYFFIEWDLDNAEDCAHKESFDLNAFCVSHIEKEQKFHLAADSKDFSCVTAAVPSEDGVWWFDDVEGNNDDGYYSTAHFPSNDLVVYVIDTVVNLDHPNFDHIPDSNKQYIGEIYNVSSVSEGDHGTHVAGLLVGQYYGVIRDSNITIKTCNAFPDGYGTTAALVGCFEDVIDDFKSGKKNNTDLRALITLSASSDGCYTWFDDYFKEATNDGAIIVVAAGNDNADACNYTPACSPYVLTVGAYNSDHDRTSFSNYGDCVDTWGPGSDIRSSLYDDTYGESFGTTMAAAIIGGMAGQFMNLQPNITDTSFIAMRNFLHEDDYGIYSFNVGDCQGSWCRAISMSCQAFALIVWPDYTTVKPTPSPTNFEWEFGKDEVATKATKGVWFSFLGLIAFALPIAWCLYRRHQKKLEKEMAYNAEIIDIEHIGTRPAGYSPEVQGVVPATPSMEIE